MCEDNFSIKLKCLKCNHEWEYKGVKHRTRCPNRKCRKWVKTGLVTPYTLGTHRKKTSQKIDKRKGRQLSIDTIMQREHYRAIIAINHYFDKGEGITRPQYRWVLIKDHDRIEKTSTFKGRKKDFDNFFKHDRFGNKRVLKRILSSDNNLGNFLKHLVDYQILERFEDEKGVERFKLKVDALQLLKHRALHVIIEIFGRIDGIDSLYDLLVNYVREKHNTFFDLSESPLGIKIKIKKGAYRG